MAEETNDTKPQVDVSLTLAEVCDRIDFLLAKTIPDLQVSLTAASNDLSACTHGLRTALQILDPLIASGVSVDLRQHAPALTTHLEEIASACRDITELHKTLIARLPIPTKGGSSV